MKAPQQHGKPTDTDAKDKPGNKMQCLKPGKHSKKSSGNVGAKCIRGDAKSHTGSKIIGSKIPLKGGSFMVAPFSNSTNLLAQPPNHSGKMKLQFFPIDEEIQNVLQNVIISVFFARDSYKFYRQCSFKFSFLLFLWLIAPLKCNRRITILTWS